MRAALLTSAVAAIVLTGCAKTAPSESTTSITPAPRTEAVLPSGWKEISTSGIALAFPPDWKAFDLTQEALTKGGDSTFGNDPKTKGMMQQVKTLAAQGIFKVFVFDQKTIGTGFATNCNVSVTPLPSGATAEMAAQQAKTMLSSMIVPGSPVDIDNVTITSGKAVRMRSQLKTTLPAAPVLQSLAYLIAKDSNLVTVTFTSTKPKGDEVAKVAEKTMATFRFSP